MYLSKNIRYLRRKYNCSQDEIAEKLGYKSYTTIQKWEMGVSQPSIGKVRQLAELFNVEMEDLVNRDIEDMENDSLNNSTSEDHKDHYYLNEETREIAQEVFENPELRSLFKVARDIEPDELRAYVDLMKKLKQKERGNYDEGC